MDIRDVIIIKFIVKYYCLSAYSIRRHGEPVAHARHKLKSRLLLSNGCYAHWILRSRSVSLTKFLANQVALFIVLEGNLQYMYTWDWLQLARSIPSAESARSLGQATAMIMRWFTVRAPARVAPFSSYTCRALQDQVQGTLILAVYQYCH